MIKIKWITLLVLTALILTAAGCGGGGGSSTGVVPEIKTNETSDEFQAWLNTIPATPEEFVTYWEETEVDNGWRYVDWDELSWEEHRFDTAEEIWESKLTNCHRMTNLLLGKYDGEYLYIDQEGAYDHAVFQGTDDQGTYYISQSGLKLKFCRTYEEIFEAYQI